MRLYVATPRASIPVLVFQPASYNPVPLRICYCSWSIYPVGYIHGPDVQSTIDLRTPEASPLRHPYANAIVTVSGVIRLSVA